VQGGGSLLKICLKNRRPSRKEEETAKKKNHRREPWQETLHRVVHAVGLDGGESMKMARLGGKKKEGKKKWGSKKNNGGVKEKRTQVWRCFSRGGGGRVLSQRKNVAAD